MKYPKWSGGANGIILGGAIARDNHCTNAAASNVAKTNEFLIWKLENHLLNRGARESEIRIQFFSGRFAFCHVKSNERRERERCFFSSETNSRRCDARFSQPIFRIGDNRICSFLPPSLSLPPSELQQSKNVYAVKKDLKQTHIHRNWIPKPVFSIV